MATESSKLLTLASKKEAMHNKQHLDLGDVRVTEAALQALADASVDVSVYLSRHASVSAFEGYSVISTYRLSSGKQLLIITESDHSETAILLWDDL